MTYDLTCSCHKGTASSAHLGHNRRTIAVPHADPSRKHLNICFVDMDIKDAYEELFGEALREYNKGKKPSRQIPDYYEHIMKQFQEGEERLQQAISSGASRKEQRRIKSRYPKPFYEVIVTLGNRDAYDGMFACGGEKEETSVEILSRYIADFEKRNPHLKVFSCHMHRDETSCHLHIDYIPFTDLPGRGLPVRVSENGAFIQQGLTTGKMGDFGTVKFQEQERQAIAEIAKEYDINIVEGRHSRKHLKKEEYILRQEQHKLEQASLLVEENAEAVLQEQNDLVEFLQTSDAASQYLEHKENIELRGIKQRSDITLNDAWNEFNNATSDYFAKYRKQKQKFYEELTRARQDAFYEKKQLGGLLQDIAYGNDFFIVKLLKLVVALFIAVGADIKEQEVIRLQEQNRKLKELSKNILVQSNEIAFILKTKDINEFEIAFKEYDRLLEASIAQVYEITSKNNINEIDR